MRATLVVVRNYSWIKYIFFLTLDRTLGFLSFRRQPVDLFSTIYIHATKLTIRLIILNHLILPGVMKTGLANIL